MSDSFDKLRKAVFAEIHRQRSAETTTDTDRAKVFGAFVEECLVNRGRSRADFARALDIEAELADAILDGLLPESEIADEFLSDIARVISYEPNLLRLMLGREITPAPRDDQAERHGS